MISAIDPMVITLTGSLRAIIPITAVSTAPIPTHTSYAGPTGRVFSANISPAIEAMSSTKNANVGQSRLNPSDAFRDSAQPASMIPENTRTTHAMIDTLPRRPGPGCPSWQCADDDAREAPAPQCFSDSTSGEKSALVSDSAPGPGPSPDPVAAVQVQSRTDGMSSP